jgi:hypothetical protein
MINVFKFAFLFLCLNAGICFSSEPIEPDSKRNMDVVPFISSLLIPSNQSYTNPGWISISKKLNSVAWLAEGIQSASESNQKIGNYYSREGRVIFSHNGLPLYEILGKKPQPGDWSLELLGARSFVNEISFKMLNHTQEYNFDIVSILKNNNYSVTLYKCSKESEPAISGNVVYTVKLKHFKTLWLKEEWSCGSAGCAAYLTLYYNKNRAKRSKCYGS